MVIQRFKVALNNALFPLVSTKAQRAVFVPGLDSAPRKPRTFMLYTILQIGTGGGNPKARGVV